MRKRACEGCYKSRTKCEYPKGDSTTCIRCQRQNRVCTRRGTRKVNKEPTKKEGFSLEPLGSMMTNEGNMAINHLAANTFMKLYKAMGYGAPPRQAIHLIHCLYLSALASKSMSALHVSTSLSLSCVCYKDIETKSLLDGRERIPENVKQETISFGKKWIIERGVDEKSSTPIVSASFVIRIARGKKEVYVSEAYQELFDDSTGFQQSNLAPHSTIWKKFVTSNEVALEIHEGIWKSFLKSKEIIDGQGCSKIDWEYNKPNVEISDKSGNVYIVDVVTRGLSRGDGFIMVTAFSFSNLRPKTGVRKPKFEALVSKPLKIFQYPSMVESSSSSSSYLSVAEQQPKQQENKNENSGTNEFDGKSIYIPALPSPTIITSQPDQSLGLPFLPEWDMQDESFWGEPTTVPQDFTPQASKIEPGTWQ